MDYFQWSKECNVIQNTVTGGETIVNKVFQNKTETTKRITNNANIGSVWKLKKFTKIISEWIKNGLKINNVENLREFMNLLNSTSNTNIDQVQKVYSSFHSLRLLKILMVIIRKKSLIVSTISQ